MPLAPARGHAREPRQDDTVSQKARPGAGKTPRKKCPAKAGRDYGVPGAAKNTGDDACLLKIWLFENLAHQEIEWMNLMGNVA